MRRCHLNADAISANVKMNKIDFAVDMRLLRYVMVTNLART